MKELLAYEKIAKLASCIGEDFIKKDNEISKLKDTIKTLKTLELKLKTATEKNRKYEEILNLTPGTDSTKVELLEYFTSEVIPHISEKIGSKYTSKIIEFLDNTLSYNFNKNEEKHLESNSQKYYVYSHTIEGELFPFYIGFSRNIDGDYKRSKDFSTRSYSWFEYIFSKGGFNNVKINSKILVEIETEKEALELETYFIKYYSESVVNTLKK
jgi:hypothetical protein